MMVKNIKNEEEHYEINIYDSSNVLASKYKFDTKDLVIIFASGRQYLYKSVIKYHYSRLIHSSSIGKGVKEHIIKNYEGTFVSKIDVADFKKEFGL